MAKKDDVGNSLEYNVEYIAECVRKEGNSKLLKCVIIMNRM